MNDDKLDMDESQTAAKTEKPAAKKKRGRNMKLAIAGVAVAVVAVVGVGMNIWHEQPDFCSTVCHIEGTYVDNYMQEQGVSGTDKFGNDVSNTNAMMAVLHRSNLTTAKPEIVCVDCHEPNMIELAHDGVNFVTGNYPMPREERSASALTSWDGNTSESFCANENCHVYLLGNDGELSYEKLAAVTAGNAFNPHEQHHQNLSLECTDCHKGHRASTVVCTACHEHANVELPDGWVSYGEAMQLLDEGYRS